MSAQVRWLRRRAIAVSVTLLVASLFTSPAGATCDVPINFERGVPEVTMTVLPSVDGSTEGSPAPLPLDINNQGQIVGQTFGFDASGDVSSTNPTLWRNGQPTALPADRPFGEIVRHVNERGQILVASSTKPYLWSNGEVVELPVTGWDPVDLNDSGQVLLQWTDDVAVWQGGELTPVVPPGDPVTVVGRDLSEAGHVAGSLIINGLWSGPFIWQDGTFTRLATAGDAYRVNRSGQVISFGTIWDTDGTATSLGFSADDLNDRGQVVGARTVGDVKRAVLWEDGKLTDLGTLGGENSHAREVNERGQVVGTSQTADGVWHAFVWSGGQMIDLGRSLGDNGPYDINDHGQIIGQIRIDEASRLASAVLWEVQDDSDAGDRLELACASATNGAPVERRSG